MYWHCREESWVRAQPHFCAITFQSCAVGEQLREGLRGICRNGILSQVSRFNRAPVSARRQVLHPTPFLRGTAPPEPHCTSPALPTSPHDKGDGGGWSTPRPFTLTLIHPIFHPCDSVFRKECAALSENQNFSPEPQERCQHLCPMLQHFQPLPPRLFTPVESKKVGGFPQVGFSPLHPLFFLFLTLPSVPFSSVKAFPQGPAPLYTPGNCDVVFYSEVNINIISI